MTIWNGKMGIFSYQPLNKSLCPPVHRSHIFVCTTLRFYKKCSQNFACIVERFTNRYIILIGLFLMELLPFLLHQQICSWMSSFIINSNGSTLSKLAHYHMKIRILLQFDLTIFERVPGKICSRKNKLKL
jgi:hypothetical protein